MSTKKKSTKKEEAPPFEQRIQDMFTTDPEKIRAYIASSRSRRYAASIDPDVILKINIKAQKFTSLLDFTGFLSTIPEDEYNMLLQFQNILDKNDRVTKILQKKYPTEEEELYLMNWNTTNCSNYYEANHPDTPYEFDESDYI